MFKDLFNKNSGRKKIALALYDFFSAYLASLSQIDFILVGDSLGMNVFGDKDTKSVTLTEMKRHVLAVTRGNIKNIPIVVDLPFMSYETPDMALESVKVFEDFFQLQFIYKLEGCPKIIEFLAKKGVFVMGHTGLKPQTAEKYRVVGKTMEEEKHIFKEAKNICEAGAKILILECVPSKLAQSITENLSIPTIGIGAGPFTDGQILVLLDMLGLTRMKKPRFVRQYIDLGKEISKTIVSFKEDVISGRYPNESESYL